MFEYKPILKAISFNFYPMESFFTVSEIAKFLRLNPLTIYEYIRKGKLPALRFGRYYRIRKQDFQAFIQRQKVIVERT